MSHDRITELEFLVTQHERLLEQYSELIRAHQTHADKLEKRIEALEQKLSKYAQPAESDDPDERPPHY